MVSERLRVGIFPVGYLGADVHRVCRLLEAGQQRYDFEIATPIRNLGNPDLFGYAYSDKAFERAVSPHRVPYDLCVVLTAVPIEGNYFTRDIDRSLILCTSHQSDEYQRASGRSVEEYFALSVCPELISVEFQNATGQSWQALFHGDVRGCLFDFQGSKDQVTAYLSNAGMCDQCRGLLSGSNVNQNALDYVDSILSKVRQPSIRKAALASIINPVLGFLYGSLVGSLISFSTSLAFVTIPISRLQLGVLATLAAAVVGFPTAVYIYQWLVYLKRTRRF